ncbi:phage tail protein [Lactobacillus gigeriorum]|uniref:Phage major tail protein n=1 Tax=Lactobacillus gigeriorum DSM 23908 = CRBIP 24.85 TaxID=1423751 RepID=I7LFU8_9LACO|nr:phage tail protein [Lactobacillus gigeriorum]KRN12008.1 phage major tail protein [Lactobacillus gigeriorum DSM 23908 = CRBIP 24.85]CCI86978.1 Phage major tail protein [Lactobacillus gigeriorum DSM 23908 = CRBIP 24.85]
MANTPGSATHGIKATYFAMIDDEHKVIADNTKGLSTSGIYRPHIGVMGTTAANYQNLDAAGNSQYADNESKRNTRPSQTPTLELSFLDIGFTESNKLTGYVQGEDGGWSRGKIAPHFAVLTVADTLDGGLLFEAFGYATGVDATHNHQTDNNDEQDVTPTFTATGYGAFETTDGEKLPYRKWLSTDAKFDFDKMINTVFPGFKADGEGEDNVPSFKGTKAKPVPAV